MCDDSTERDLQRWLAEKRLGRREFNALGATATAALLVPGCSDDGGSHAATASPDAAATSSSLVSIDMPDGSADAFFVHPTSGKHPAIVVWPDILGLRDAFKTMGTRLAASGYAVLVVNQYYRTSPAPVLASWDEWMSDDGKAKLQPNLDAITAGGIQSDGGAFLDWLDQQAPVDTKRKAGSSGYCMGGPFTFRTALSRPDRVGAIASLHGGSLVTDAPDSPHRLIANMKARMLIAIAQNDDQRQPDAKTALTDAAESAKLSAEIEVYPAMHGWCAIDSAAYDETQAEKAWSRMLALFGKL